MRHCYVVRVFTDGDTGGNHLGVITDVTGLDDATMQSIAADLGFSETVFVDWRSGGAPLARIFTPNTELPFAGHPLVGCAWVLGALGPGGPGTIRFGAGEAATRMEGDFAWVDLQPMGDVSPAADGPGIAAAAGLPEPTAAWWVRVPLPYLVLEVSGDGEVASADPDMDVLAEHFGTYLVHRDGDRVHARFFAPGAGVPEDPATGSAAVAFAALCRNRGEVEGRVAVSQGAEMGHPSRIDLRWDAASTSLGGTVVRDEVRVLDA